MVGSLVLHAAHAGVHAFGVFADDHEVDFVGSLVLERGLDVGIELDGTQVDVLVELEAGLEQDALFEDAGRDVRVADGAQKDAVETAKIIQSGVGQGLACAEVAFASEIELGEVVGKTFRSGGGLEDFERFGGDFRSGSVAGNYSYAMHKGPWPNAAA